MSQSRMALGRWGEAVAKRYLLEQGWTIRGCNVRTPRGEIDIVAWDGNCLVFVEVKTRRGDRFGSALESVDDHKQRRLMGAARAYLAMERISPEAVRFDVLAITIVPQTGRSHPPKIDHVVNAFDGW